MDLDFDIPIWVCADGRIIAVEDLEETHLVNIVEMCRRNGEVGMLLEPEDDDILQATFPIFTDLLWECIIRGLMDGDSGKWLRPPQLGEVDVSNQLEAIKRIHFPCPEYPESRKSQDTCGLV